MTRTNVATSKYLSHDTHAITRSMLDNCTHIYYRVSVYIYNVYPF